MTTQIFEIRHIGKARYEIVNTVTGAICQTCRNEKQAREAQRYLEAKWGEKFRARATAQAAPAPAETLVIGGHTVTAPGFTAQQFDAAVHRAHVAGLTARPARYRGAAYVRNPQRPEPYLTTRTTCTCTAGQHGRPCHHRAFILFLEFVCGESVLSQPQVAA